jgi:hypothetical protein
MLAATAPFASQGTPMLYYKRVGQPVDSTLFMYGGAGCTENATVACNASVMLPIGDYIPERIQQAKKIPA